MQKVTFGLDLALSQDDEEAKKQYTDACTAYIMYRDKYQEAEGRALSLEKENIRLLSETERAKYHIKFVESYNRDLLLENEQLKKQLSEVCARNRTLRNKLKRRPWWQRFF